MYPIKPTLSKSDVPLDVMLNALSHVSRRRILDSLRTHNPRATGEFEERSFWPEGTDEDEISIALHHTHLPCLEEAEVIDWNSETGTVFKGPKFDEIRPLLRLMQDHESKLPDDWP